MRASTSNKRERRARTGGRGQSEAGTTMIEMVVAMGIMMVGMLGLVASLAWGLSASKRLRDMSDSKLTITSMLEQMEMLRNTKRLTFGQIANTGQVSQVGSAKPFGGFPTGFQSVSTTPGPDGIYGTGDDLVDAGPDGIYKTSDDFVNNNLARAEYQRKIEISFLGANLKKIKITMRYPGREGKQQELVGTSYLNDDANSNFR